MSTCNAATTILRQVIREALKPTDPIPLDEWSDRYRIIPVGQSEMPGRWQTEQAPYLAGIMQALSDPSIEMVTFMKGSQVGGTEIAQNWILYLIDVDPGPLLCVYPNAELAGEVNRDRLTPSLLACERTRRRLRSQSPRELKTYQLHLDRMNVRMVGSNSEANLASRPCRYVLFDEIDAPEFMPRAITLGHERTKAFTRRKIFHLSKPGREGEGIHALYATTDKRRYWVPCPHCGEFQVLGFTGVKWEGGRGCSPEHAERTAWYECSGCKARIENHHKPRMMRAGRWLAHTQYMRGQEVIGEAPVTRHAGFQLSSLYAIRLPWGYVAKKFLESGCIMTADICNGDLGEPFSSNGDRAEAEQVKALAKPVDQGGYRMARRDGSIRLPAGVLCLVGGVDLQRDRAYVEIRGFGAGGKDSWLIWHDVRRCPVDQSGSLAAIDELVTGLEFTTAGGARMKVACWGIDSGDGERTREVYQWTNRYRHVYATKGRSGETFSQLYELKLLPYDGDSRGTRVTGTAKFLTINVDRYKEHILSMIRQAKPGETNVRAVAGASRIHFPADVEDEYCQQITSEQMVREIVRTGRNQGRPALVWRKRPGRADNHFLDTCVIAHCLADAQGVQSLVAPSTAAPVRKAAPARVRDEGVSAGIDLGGDSVW